jgi:Zinc finger C-x8-C-x5-C-x3-H type (and similar)
MSKGFCRNGDQCNYAHGDFDLQASQFMDQGYYNSYDGGSPYYDPLQY